VHVKLQNANFLYAVPIRGVTTGQKFEVMPDKVIIMEIMKKRGTMKR
jgi:hypothetical protein